MSYLTEAFKQLNIIDEDLFPTDSEGLNKLKDFMKSDIDDEDLVVYDETANNEDEIKDSYNGKVILRCNVCKSHFFKEPKSVIIDAEAGLANVGDECCYCHNDMGYNVVGVVAPYAADVSKEERAEDAHENNSEVDEVNESVKRINESDITVGAVMDQLNKCYGECNIAFKYDSGEEAEDFHKVVMDWANKNRKRFIELRAATLEAGDIDLDDVETNGGYGIIFIEDIDRISDDVRHDIGELVRDMKGHVVATAYNKSKVDQAIASRFVWLGSVNESVKRINEETNYDKVMRVLNNMRKEEPTQESLDDINNKDFNESAKKVNEDLKDVSITTDDTKIQMTAEENGKVTVTTEPVKNEMNIEDTEVIKPLSAADKDIIANNDGEDGEEVLDDEAIDFDEINDEDLDKLGEKYFTKVYDNVKSFKSTACKLNESGVILEGKITFKSGKEAKTAFNFNEAYVTKTGKVKLIGENAQFAKNKKAFTLTGSLNNKKLVVESFTYNYRTKDEKTGKSTRLYGTVSK